MTKPASESKAVLECGIASSNCKNLNTSKHAIDKLSQNYDIILLQEHWLFDCQLHKLKEFHENYSGVGKAVDSDDPILPVQMPRGYGGVGILWKKDIDHLISVIPDGGNRLQSVTVKADQPILVISAYMPCKGTTDNYDSFVECLDQLREIILKFRSTHSILFGGDFNEDYLAGSTRRSSCLKEFLSDFCLATTATEKTFIHPNGVDSTTIDYLFYSHSFTSKVLQVKRLDFVENNSDHYPVRWSLKLNLDKAQKKDSRAVNSIKVNWKKTDLEAYRLNLTELLSNFEVTAASASDLDNSVIKFNNILQKAASVAGHSTVKRMRKPKLVNWSPQIRLIVKEKKSAFAQWEKEDVQMIRITHY